MNADEIGEIGESYFRQICARDSLIANKSDRDRTGWDFLVEWPAVTNSESPRDILPPRPSCFVQVKAVLSATKSISLRLSSAERLVKARLPAFVYVPRVNDKGIVTHELIIHVEEEFSRTVLKRLRQAHVDGEKPNNVFISLSLRKYGKTILPASTFRSDVESTIGDDFNRVDQLDLQFNIHEVTACKQQIEFLHAMLWPDEGKARITFKSDLMDGGISSSTRLPFVFPVILSDALIGIVSSGTFSSSVQDDGLFWEGHDLSFEYARELSDLEGELDQLAEEARTALNSDSSIVFNVNELHEDG